MVNYRDGRFCQEHLPYDGKCGIKGCLLDARADVPACDQHLSLYRQFEVRFGRDRSLLANRRQMRRLRAIADGEAPLEWEPAPQPWDSAIEHYWQARHVKVVEIAVTPCGVPISFTKFPFAEGENNIAEFMNATWPVDDPSKRPTYLVIDKGCKVMATLHARQELLPPHGWMATTNLKVDPWHYNGHRIDALCVKWCNPNDEHDPNLVQAMPARADTSHPNALGHSRRARGRRAATTAERLQRSFNFEASEQLNAYLEPFSSAMRKMKPDSHDVFLCIVLKERAEDMMRSQVQLV